MTYNQKLEQLLDFSLEDYPSTAYSLIEEMPRSRGHLPEYFSYRFTETPIYGLFGKIEVVTENYITNRRISLVDENFVLSQLDTLRSLIDQLTEIYGADEKRKLWLSEEEEEEIALNNWEGRYWEFPNNEDIRDVSIFLDANRLSLVIYERGNLLDFI